MQGKKMKINLLSAFGLLAVLGLVGPKMALCQGEHASESASPTHKTPAKAGHHNSTESFEDEKFEHLNPLPKKSHPQKFDDHSFEGTNPLKEGSAAQQLHEQSRGRDDITLRSRPQKFDDKKFDSVKPLKERRATKTPPKENLDNVPPVNHAPQMGDKAFKDGGDLFSGDAAQRSRARSRKND